MVQAGMLLLRGEVAERLKAHDSKSCVGQPTEGSNPSLSAMYRLVHGSAILSCTVQYMGHPVLYSSGAPP
jgi:hypothetical protein